MTSLILAGLGVAGVALTTRILTRSLKEVQKHAARLPNTPMFTSYYKGGFERKMTRREAGLILGMCTCIAVVVVVCVMSHLSLPKHL